MNFWRSFQAKHYGKKKQRQAVCEYMNQLHLIRTEGEMQCYPCDIYFGYFSDEQKQFEEFIPIVLDVMQVLYKDALVVTHLRSIQREDSQPFADFLSQTKNPEFAHCVCSDISDGSSVLFRCTQGADVELLRKFYQSPVSSRAENFLYGFYNTPPILCNDEASMVSFLNANTHDILCSYHRFHVGITIQVQTTPEKEDDIRQSILAIANAHGKNLQIEME